MPSIPVREQKRLAAVIDALEHWTDAAAENRLRVTQVNVDLMSADGESVICPIVFELLDPAAGEYGFRTP